MEEAEEIAKKINFDTKTYDIEQLRRGLEVELEHGTIDPATNVTDDDPVKTALIAYAHIKEIPDYYKWLDEMEDKAETYWESQEN